MRRDSTSSRTLEINENVYGADEMCADIKLRLSLSEEESLLLLHGKAILSDWGNVRTLGTDSFPWSGRCTMPGPSESCGGGEGKKWREGSKLELFNHRVIDGSF